MDEHPPQLSDSAHSGIDGQQMKDLELAKYGSGPPAEEPINLDEEALGTCSLHCGSFRKLVPGSVALNGVASAARALGIALTTLPMPQCLGSVGLQKGTL